jgi:UDP-GlcNAc:undecaprenyl-phosphate/decaprenyl-phosphate GlcNAc-1-phosphate transferase
MIYLSTLLLALLITIFLIPLLIKIAEKMKTFDLPDERKVHTVPIPRIGGLAIAIGVFMAVFLWKDESGFLKAYIISSAFIVFFGIIDDVTGLNYKMKFSCQVAATLIIVFYGGLKVTHLGALLPENMLVPEWMAIPFTIVLIVGVTNAVNLADGLDGLAGGICLLSFCCIGYLSYLVENTTITLLSLALIGVIFGFLRFNTYPASLFMGDTGSQFLGFSLVTTSLALTQGHTALSPVLPLLIFGFPVLDTMAIILYRLSERRSPFLPDKKHFHHRLMDLGLFHTEAVLIIYLIQAVFVVSAFIFRFYSEWSLLIGYGLFSLLIVGSFIVAVQTHFTLKRHNFVNKAIKGPLEVLREKGLFIKIFFKTVEFGIPLFMLATCFIPRAIPRFLSIFSAIFIAVIIIVWFLKKSWLRVVLTVTLSILIPLTVYLSSTDTRLPERLDYFEELYNYAFAFLVFSVVLTLRFTRRRRGFKVTPMDFLILFIALVAPYIAGIYTTHKEIGTVAAKTIMLFLSYEVLIGELRGSFDKLTFATVCALLAITARGLLEA